MQRRKFIKQAGLGLTAASIGPKLFSIFKTDHPLGIQLYSLKENIKTDAGETVAKIAEIGFKEIETFGYSGKNKFWGKEIKEFKKMLEYYELTSPSGHYNLNPFLQKEGTIADFEYVLEVAKNMGQKYVIIPAISKDLRDGLDNYKRVADKMNEAGLLCKNAGIRLAYHNHAFEFEDYNGQNGYNILLQNTDEDLVYYQMDIYWVVRGGKDPVQLITENPGRFPLWHVKDMDKSNDELNIGIGQGSIDFNRIFKNAKKAGTKHFILEQENFEMDPYTSLGISYNYIENKLLPIMN